MLLARPSAASPPAQLQPGLQQLLMMSIGSPLPRFRVVSRRGKHYSNHLGRRGWHFEALLSELSLHIVHRPSGCSLMQGTFAM